jgi:LysM repeat protein
VGYWGWRPLIFALCISVLIVGCSITTDSAPTQSPTDLPRVTLTLRLPSSSTPITTPTRPIITTLQPSPTPEASSTPFIQVAQSGDTLLGIAIQYGVDLNALREANGNLDPRSLQIGQQLIIPDASNPSIAAQATPTPLALPVDPPTCYETPTLSLLCLGQVANTLDHPVERAVVTIQLYRADGAVLLEKTTSVEQTIIPAGQSAPYRVLFPTGWQGYGGIAVVLRSAASAQGVDERFIAPVIENELGVLENDHYIVSATLRNADLQSAEALRIIVTLFGESQQVVGYRVMQLESPLQAGASLPIRVAVAPQVASEVLTHTLYVEAWRGS